MVLLKANASTGNGIIRPAAYTGTGELKVGVVTILLARMVHLIKNNKRVENK